MRKSCIAIAVPALFVAIAVPTSASARHIITLSGTYSRSQVKKDCDAVGGVYQSDSSGYFCASTSNGNSVNCNNRGKCTGSIPRQSRPSRTIGGILHPPSAGLSSSANDGAPNGHRPPVKFGGFRAPSAASGDAQPMTMMHSEVHYSGGHRR
jgi:hypothetical protein